MEDAEAQEDATSAQRSVSRTIIASALAGMISRIPCHPIDTCKARIQVHGATNSSPIGLRATPSSSFIQTWRVIARSEGLRGFYRGFGTAFIGSGPAACVYFTTYELTASFLLANPAMPWLSAHPAIGHFSAGLIAEAFSCLLWVPIDVVKERLQVQPALLQMMPEGTEAYKGNIDAIKTILRKEGISGIYRGYGATLMSFGPFSALYFMIYEQLKYFAHTALSPASLPTPTSPSLLSITHASAPASASESSITPLSTTQELLTAATPSTPTQLATAPVTLTPITTPVTLAPIPTPMPAPASLPTHEPEVRLIPKVIQPLPFVAVLLCAATAASTAAFITNPLDLAKLRIQIERRHRQSAAPIPTPSTPVSIATTPTPLATSIENKGLYRYRNVWDGVKQIYTKEGLRGLYRGALARVFFQTPATAISLTFFEMLKVYAFV